MPGRARAPPGKGWFLRYVVEQIILAIRLLHYDPDLHALTGRTIHLAFESAGLAVLIGAVPAYLIGVRTTRSSRWALVLANTGLGLPAVAVGIFLVLLTPEWYGTFTGMVAGQTVLSLPVIIALGAAAIRELPDGLLEQARAYGATEPRIALLALVEARIGVLTAVIIALGSAIAEVGAVTIIGGNFEQNTATLASEILNDVIGHGFVGGLGESVVPPMVEHALVVVGLMLVLAAILTIVQQWGHLQRRQQRRLAAAIPFERPARVASMEQ
jgi:tungstate transport system permease protein